ncbi:hypothetical protein A6R68_12747 [Neotoma lepida]|uniref:Uncharacterized protein n=1 Tax=Neotoma lepida TaxID=56216 RepID=A0A1A6H2Z2_NEOLE|nr:hypothetical protein A6R68_12747 [Neotoma lepida]
MALVWPRLPNLVAVMSEGVAQGSAASSQWSLKLAFLFSTNAAIPSLRSFWRPLGADTYSITIDSCNDRLLDPGHSVPLPSITVAAQHTCKCLLPTSEHNGPHRRIFLKGLQCLVELLHQAIANYLKHMELHNQHACSQLARGPGTR